MGIYRLYFFCFVFLTLSASCTTACWNSPGLDLYVEVDPEYVAFPNFGFPAVNCTVCGGNSTDVLGFAFYWEILPGVHMDLTADPVKDKFRYEVGQPYVIPGSGKQFRTERMIIRPSFRNVLTCPRCNFLCKAWVIRGDVTIQRVNKPFTVQKT